MEKKERIAYIDGLRGLAALMVIVVHSANFIESGLLPNFLLTWMKLGRYGVQIFYIISAFTIMLSAEKCLAQGGWHFFYLRRFFRIAPMWYISLLVMFFYNLLKHNEKASLGSIITHMLGLHGLFPQYIGDIIGQGWSVSIEILFYLLIPVIIRKWGLRLEKYIKLICLLTAGVWVINSLAYKISLLLPWNIDSTFWYLWLPNQFVAFLIGICLYLIIIKKVTITDWSKSALWLIGICIEVFLGISEVLTRSLIIGVIVLVLAKYSSKIVDNVIFRFVGKVSFGVYLSHMLIIFVFKDLGFMLYSSIVTLFIYFLVVPLLSILVGIISYYFVERPMLKLERKIEKQFL